MSILDSECIHTTEFEFFNEGVCKRCGMTCDHPEEFQEVGDDRSFSNFGSEPVELGSKHNFCGICGMGLTSNDEGEE